jgi:hypothetical protein
MYYRLIALDRRRLPASCRFEGRASARIHSGGLLLDPAGLRPDLGRAILQLNHVLGGIESQRFLMSEAYVWVSKGSLHVARALPLLAKDEAAYVRDPGPGDPVVYFSGIVNGRRLKLIAEASNEGNDGFLTAGSVLSFEMAPEDPITDEWWFSVAPGQPMVIEYGAPGPMEDEALDGLIEAEYEAARRAAWERLREAWRAPA